MAIFRRYDACAYALKWALSRNPDYPDFSGQGGGGDCANFVSQSLLAGGCPMDRIWWGGKNSATIAWNRASHLRHHLSTSRWATRCTRNELWSGDVVFCFLNGQVVHSMIVTSVFPSIQNLVFLCGHSNDRRNYELQYVDSFYGPKNVEYLKMAANVRIYSYGMLP
jgi:hypothetical protein